MSHTNITDYIVDADTTNNIDYFTENDTITNTNTDTFINTDTDTFINTDTSPIDNVHSYYSYDMDENISIEPFDLNLFHDVIFDHNDINNDINNENENIENIENENIENIENIENFITGGFTLNNTSSNDINHQNEHINDVKQNIVTQIHTKIVPETISECSIINNNSSTCSDHNTIIKIKEALQINKSSPDEIIESAKNITQCDTERCVLTSDKLSNVLSDTEIKTELNNNFKLPGPTGIELLNNFNIDRSLLQWQLKFPKFYAYNFNMRDYKRQNDTLATVNIHTDIYKKSYNTFACVINSDLYSGRGIHWMAFFGDFRNPNKFTVEFFNSSGQSPCSEFNTWLNDAKNSLQKIIQTENIPNCTAEAIKVCNVKQQNSLTECGVYSLYYIWARLNNIPYEFFLKHRIEDEKMFEFRQHLFWNKQSIFQSGKHFVTTEFAKHYSPKWE